MKLEPREYQLELYRQAIQENVIICSDTGTGKTLIAKLVIDFHFNNLVQMNQSEGINPKKWIIFLVPTVVLCKQQQQYLQRNGHYSVGIFHGELNVQYWNREKWRREYSQHQVFVMTAQILLDNLRHAIISFDHIELLIFDECHHAKKAHPYNRIMVEFYSSTTNKPRILGLTASPVSSGISKSDSDYKQSKLLQQLASNLNCKIITPSKNLLEKSLGSQPEEIIEYYTAASPCYSEAIDPVTDNCPDLLCLKFLFSQHSHNSVITSLGSWAGAHLSQELLNDLSRFPDGKYFSDYNQHIQYLSHFRDNWSSLLDHRSPIDPHHISNQAALLIKILSNHIQSLHGSQVCVIIFVQTKYTACYLAKLLQSLSTSTYHEISISCSHCGEKGEILAKAKRLFREAQINTDYLVSKNSAARGYHSKNNTVTLDKFRQGQTHILVATSVAEEGLDVQPCQLVIRFQEIQTVSSYVQSRGRARHLSSKYIVLESHEEDSSNFNSVRACEKLMRAQLVQQISPNQPPLSLGMDDVYIVPSTGARVTLNSSITLIYQYCDTLLRDSYTSISPQYILISEDESTGWYQYDLHFPSQCSIPTIHGTIQNGKLLAKRNVSLIACRALHKAGLLDDNLCPIRVSDRNKRMQQQPVFANPVSNSELQTIDLLLASMSWEDLLSHNGRVLHIYTLTDLHGKLPDVLMTGIRLKMKFEMKIQESERASTSIFAEYVESKQFSSEQLLTFQHNFGLLMTNYASSTFRHHLVTRSTYPSPILLTQMTSEDSNSLHYSHVPLSAIVQEVERLMNLFLCQETLQIQFNDINLLREALTAPSSQQQYDYNRLETLGDAVLKLLSSLWLLEKYPLFTEGELSVYRAQHISNDHFYQIGLSSRVQYFLEIKKLSTKAFIPPGYLPERRAEQTEENLGKILSSNKIIADVVESIIGAVYLDTGRSLASTWYMGCLPLHVYERNTPYPHYPSHPSSHHLIFSPSNIDMRLIDHIQNLLVYQFNHPQLLIEAFTHQSYLSSPPPPPPLSSTSSSSPYSSYQRLEFLGDAILGLITTEFLYDWSPMLSSGEITTWKSFIVSNEFLSFLSIQYGFPSYLKSSSLLLQSDIQEYIRQTSMNTFDTSTIKNFYSLYSQYSLSQSNPPKVLADIFESLIGAIFLDCSRNLTECKRFISSLIFEPYIIPCLVDDENRLCLKDFHKHPISQFYEILSTFSCSQIKILFPDTSTSTSTEELIDSSLDTPPSLPLLPSTSRDTLEHTCQILCHGHILSEGKGKQKKRAQLAAIMKIPREELVKLIQNHCCC